MQFRDEIKKALEFPGIDINDQPLDLLGQYAGLVLEYNLSLGLISKKDSEQEIIRQIVDCAAAAKFMKLGDHETLLDIGSGAGLPGIVLKIIAPEIRLISLDSNPRKITFQSLAAGKLALDDCEFISSQLSEYQPAEEIDLITVKAFGKFKNILGFGRKYLHAGAKIAFYTGEDIPVEIDDPEGYSRLEGSPFEYELQEGSIHKLQVLFKKR